MNLGFWILEQTFGQDLRLLFAFFSHLTSDFMSIFAEREREGGKEKRNEEEEGENNKRKGRGVRLLKRTLYVFVCDVCVPVSVQSEYALFS